jgi:predicted DsbA family dithiol-disulfide isomerase
MRNQQRQLWITLGTTTIVIVLFSLLLVLGMSPPAAETNGTFYAGLMRRLTPDGAPILGDPDAPVTVIEFIDFACSHCARYQSVIRTLIDQYIRPGKARLEMRVLSGLDPDGSILAARATLCAGEQSAFWEMRDELFRLHEQYGYNAFSAEYIGEAAAGLNLDVSLLTTCTNNASRYQQALQNNIDLANTFGVRTLPTILLRVDNGLPRWIEVNGTPVTGGVPLNILTEAINRFAAPGS